MVVSKVVNQMVVQITLLKTNIGIHKKDEMLPNPMFLTATTFPTLYLT
jgi:hypothetical protein